MQPIIVTLALLLFLYVTSTHVVNSLSFNSELTTACCPGALQARNQRACSVQYVNPYLKQYNPNDLISFLKQVKSASHECRIIIKQIFANQFVQNLALVQSKLLCRQLLASKCFDHGATQVPTKISTKTPTTAVPSVKGATKLPTKKPVGTKIPTSKPIVTKIPTRKITKTPTVKVTTKAPVIKKGLPTKPPKEYEY
jgi:hypothetical protein